MSLREIQTKRSRKNFSLDLASVLLCALETRWQGFGAVSFLRSFARIFFARKNRFSSFLAIFPQELFLGQFLAIFWFLLQGSRNSLAAVAGSSVLVVACV